MEENSLVEREGRTKGDEDDKSLHCQQMRRWSTDVGVVRQQWYVRICYSVV